MKIHADLSKRAVVDSNELPWVDSPLAGVQRRMLERDGDEVARATSLVRYAPGSYFDAHKHELGEEFFVLDGVFSDEAGDFPAGTYVRNPPGSGHKPRSEPGCILFVKLRQILASDQNHVCIDTTAGTWQPGNTKGMQVMPLHEFRGERVSLVRLEPGAWCNPEVSPLGQEIYVLTGVLADEHGAYPEGTWIRNPPGSVHAPKSEQGCTYYLKTGHLG